MVNGKEDRFFNCDSITGCPREIETGSVDLVITDPPYGIAGETLHKHYHRKEEYVLEGYTEIPQDEYPRFSRAWIREAERILKPGGSLYIVSGYTNLVHILNALQETALTEMNHLIWKYNFGVYTKNKYVTSHYHILFYVKPGGRHTFHTYCRYGQTEKDEEAGALNYLDREDVWIINREYKPGQIKNKNTLPQPLLIKLLQYSSNEGDVVCDLFLGSFATAKAAIGLNRYAWGFEINPQAYEYHLQEVKNVKRGSLLESLRQPEQGMLFNQGEPWTDEDLLALRNQYDDLHGTGLSKRKAIDALSAKWGRGYFSILNALQKVGR